MSSTIHLCSVSSHEFRNLFNLLNMLQPKEKNYAQINEEEGKHHPHDSQQPMGFLLIAKYQAHIKIHKYYPFPYSIYPSNKTQARQKKFHNQYREYHYYVIIVDVVAFTEMQARKHLSLLQIFISFPQMKYTHVDFNKVAFYNSYV
ncbi:hypothetical protein ACJX0J_014264, partial [Zea mays]